MTPPRRPRPGSSLEEAPAARSGRSVECPYRSGRASRAALFGHCAAPTVNAVHDPFSRCLLRLAHADRVAGAVRRDMATHWTHTVENYLSRVTKTLILEAVREVKDEAAAQRTDHLRGQRWQRRGNGRSPGPAGYPNRCGSPSRKFRLKPQAPMSRRA